MSTIEKDFIKNYDEDSDKGYILDIDVEYPKNLHDLQSYIINYIIHIRSLKEALNHGLILKKVHRVIQFNQEACLKPYINMNTELRKQAKNDFGKDFFKLMNNSVFGKMMENVWKHRDIK